MFLQKPARQLLEQQIDFDVLPSDLFAEMGAFQASFDGLLRVNGETYRALAVPYAEFITTAVARFAAQAAAAGFPVLFIEALPAGVCDCADPAESAALITGLRGCGVVKLGELTAELRARGIPEIRVEPAFAHLRYYHYIKDGQDAYMFSNESPGQTFSGEAWLPVPGPLSAYDAMDNLLRPLECAESGGGTRVRLTLRPYESTVLVAEKFEELPKRAFPSGAQRLELNNPWTLSIAAAKEYPNFHDAQVLDELHSAGKLWPDFSGFMRYETRFVLAGDPAQPAALRIDDAYEGVEVWVNEQYAGMRICPPYEFDISGLLRPGENSLRIEVANTLFRHVSASYKIPSFFGPRSVVVEPSGIVGKVAILLEL